MSIIFRIFSCSIVSLSLFAFNAASGQDADVLQKNRNAISGYFDAVINGHNLSRKWEFFHRDYVLHPMAGNVSYSNSDSMHNSLLTWLFQAVPDVHYNITHIIAGGDMVGVNTSATGTARKEMFGLPAGNGKVKYEQMFLFRMRDGKISDQWEVVDAGAITAQLK